MIDLQWRWRFFTDDPKAFLVWYKCDPAKDYELVFRYVYFRN